MFNVRSQPRLSKSDAINQSEVGTDGREKEGVNAHGATIWDSNQCPGIMDNILPFEVA
jgi:hypothetical protein